MDAHFFRKHRDAFVAGDLALDELAEVVLRQSVFVKSLHGPLLGREVPHDAVVDEGDGLGASFWHNLTCLSEKRSQLVAKRCW